MRFAEEYVWIIGASSGIGKALATLLSDEGANLILSARSEKELHQLNADLGGKHIVKPLDVTEHDKVKQVADDISQEVPSLTRVVFLAATYEPTSIRKIDLDFAKKTFDINVLGGMALTQAVLPILDKQQVGQLVLCASVASYFGLPNGQPYSASKAALKSFAESVHAEEQGNIDIKVINPGFVKTPMTDKNPFDMPMVIEPETAAQAIAKGLLSKSFEIHFPKKFTCLMKAIAALPYPLQQWVSRQIAKRAN